MNTSDSFRILIIDDNPAIHEDFKKILSPARPGTALEAEAAVLFGEPEPNPAAQRFELDSAFQGQEGLERARQAAGEGRPYSLAFVDVRMPPGWNGVETIVHLWEVCPDLQAVICTAYSDYSWENMTRRLGYSDNLVILKKPFDNIEVLQLAHALTRKWTLTRQSRARLSELDQIVAERTRELQTANEQLRREMEERLQAEKARQSSEARFLAAFNASPMPVAIQNCAEERFVDANDRFYELVGRPQAEIIDKTAQEIGLWQRPETQDRIRTAVAESRSLRNFETKIRPGVGQPREVLVSAELFEFDRQRHMLLILQDISEHVRLESRLRQSQKMEAVGQLAAGVAHDFNNLLTIIQGHSHLQLSETEIPPGVAESLKQITRASERAAALTRQLLAFSRKQVLQPRTVNFGDLFGDACKMLRRIVGEQIDFRCEPADGPPLLVYADPGSVEQIVMNLVVNARDAMPQGGRLTVRADRELVDVQAALRNPEARPGKFICLTVADSGCGMDTTILARIFEPFFTTKPSGSGTGLGLSTVYGIVKQHEGWIEVTSTVGQGSTFKVYLPETAEGCAASGHTSQIFRPALHNEGVLVVEDESVLREFVQAVLEQQGYRVYAASDGHEALQVWRQHRSDVELLVTDIVMPGGVSGLELARQIRSEKPDMEVLLTSGYSTELVSQGLSAAGSDTRFLAKPYRPQTLTAAVRSCLDRRRRNEASPANPDAKSASP